MPKFEVYLALYRGYWCAAWRQHGRTHRRSLRTQDRAVAERQLEDFKRAMAGPRETVGKIMAAYLDDRDQTAKNADRLRDAWKALKPSFEHLRPDQVTREKCRDYTAARRNAGRGDGTIKKELSTLRAGLRWHDPQTKAVFELPSAPRPKERHLSRPEARRLIDACELPHTTLYVVLALTTAGRKEALLDLEWQRVDFERGIVDLATEDDQGRKGRATLPIHALARPYLLEARKVATTPFVLEYAGKRLKSIRTGFSSACKREAIEDVTPHTLRHTAAVWMAEAGRPMSEIAQYLGHSDSRITERIYARYSPNYLRQAAEAIHW